MSTPGKTAGTALSPEVHRHLQSLMDVLEAEHEALRNRDFDCLTSCTQQKEVLLGRLAGLEPRVRGVPGDDGFTDRAAAELLRKCRELNNVNGGMIEASRQFNQRMLNILPGREGQEGELYDAAGNNAAGKPGQEFAKI